MTVIKLGVYWVPGLCSSSSILEKKKKKKNTSQKPNLFPSSDKRVGRYLLI
jgi:hypothetical protein